MGQITSWPDETEAYTRSAPRAEPVESPGFVLRMPMVGELAPAFSLPDADMEMFDLREALATHLVVLHFYPRNAMPTSTRQAISFSDHEADFKRLGAMVVGVSLDDCIAHSEFRDEHGLAIRLLSDSEGEACRLYGVWQDRFVDGVVRPAVHRSTFLIGRDGVLLHAEQLVDVRDHTARIIELLQSLSRRKNGNHKEHRRHA